MMQVIRYLISFAVLAYLGLAEPISKVNEKTKVGQKRGGFYASRFGSIYNAQDFADQPTTVTPKLLEEIQIPTGVAAPHQQNLDDLKGEIPNVEYQTARGVTLVKSNLKGGVKGGVKGILPYGHGQLTTPNIKGIAHISTIPPEIRIATTLAPLEVPIRIAVVSNAQSAVRGDVIVTTPGSVSTENLIKKKAKNVKSGRKGYQYNINNIRALFNNDKSSQITEGPLFATTFDTYNPSILNIPTKLHVQGTVAPTTEYYRQETVTPLQQTEIPVQQTEIPIQQTVMPMWEREPTTRPPFITTVQQTVLPVTTEINEPVQDTQSPTEAHMTQRPESPILTTVVPTTTPVYLDDQQTEVPQVTQLPEEPLYITQEPTTQATVVLDEFSRYPLGLDGRHLIKGGEESKGGKSKSGKGSKKVVAAKVDVLNRGVSGLSARRVDKMDPATPLLPSLRGRQ